MSLSSASCSRIRYRERERERRRKIRESKQWISRLLFAEPFLSPFHHVNLVFAELGVPFLSLEEAKKAVQEVVNRYGSLAQQKVLPSSVGEWSTKRSAKKTKKRRRNLQSILYASQTSMSQYEEHSQSLQRSALLLDAMEILCSRRDLVVERHSIRKVTDFASIPIIPHKSVLLYVDKENPFFLSVFAFFSKKIEQEHPLLMRSSGKKNTAENPIKFQVICSSPFPVQWRTVSPQCLHLVNQQCVTATIYKSYSFCKDRDVASTNDCHCEPAACRTALQDSQRIWERESAPFVSPSGTAAGSAEQEEEGGMTPIYEGRKREYAELENERENEQDTWGTIRSPISSESSTDSSTYGMGNGSFSNDSFLSSPNERKSDQSSKLYCTCPFYSQFLFSRLNTVPDPFLDLPKGYVRQKAKKEWHASAFRKCKGDNVKKRFLVEQAHKMTTENEEEWNDFLSF